MPENNPRIPFQLLTERPALAPLNGKPLMIHIVMNLEVWPFDKPMPRAILQNPHGKTPMAPDLARSLVEAGAWGTTVADVRQAAVMLRAGLTRLILGNEVGGAGGAARLATLAAAFPKAEIYAFVDSAAAADGGAVQERTRGADGALAGERARPWRLVEHHRHSARDAGPAVGTAGATA